MIALYFIASNSQSRVDESLNSLSNSISYLWRYAFLRTIEIKDALAYLRLINNRQDDAAFERVVIHNPWHWRPHFRYIA